MDNNIFSSAQKSLIISLFLSLGGAKNINSITNCMSRIRIIVKNPLLLGSDETFLALGVYGVIRQKRNIHLIYQKYSIQLSYHLSYLLAFYNDSFALSLLLLSQGADNVDRISVEDNTVYIHLKNSITIDSILLKELNQKHSVFYHISISTIEIKSSDIDLSTKLQYGALFWELIQSQYIIHNIGSSQIINFSFYNYTTKIYVQNINGITNTQWLCLGITHITKSIEEQEIQISPTSECLLSVLEQVLILVKKDIVIVDNN